MFADIYQDLTLDEEAKLPLPDNWIRTMRLSIPQGDYENDSATIVVYQDQRSGLETEEHPFITRALNEARKHDIPNGWELKEVVLSDGTPDCYYYNESEDISMWDPPYLRRYLAEHLSQLGYDPVSIGLIPEDTKKTIIHSSLPTNINNDIEDYVDSIENDYYMNNSYNSPYNMHKYILPSNPSELLHSNGLDYNNYSGREISAADISKFMQSTLTQPIKEIEIVADSPKNLEIEDLDISKTAEEIANTFIENNIQINNINDDELYEDKYHIQNHREDWISVLQSLRPEGLDIFHNKIIKVIEKDVLPLNYSTIQVLENTLQESYERVQFLLVNLRKLLGLKSGFECNILTTLKDISKLNGESDENRNSDDNNYKIMLASDIVMSLIFNPINIIYAMDSTNKPGSPAMTYIAFIVMHRILHPFCTDNNMTIALIIQALTFQLEEVNGIENILPKVDKKVIISKSLFISDPDVAIGWNPLNRPLPVVPIANMETIFTCLLRAYAIRRDVTSYYRSTWKPLLPAVLAVLNTDDLKMGPHIFANIATVADRLLELTFREKSILQFPVIALSVCRAIFDSAGQDAVLTYLFNLLILPNILKILAGDHDSTENEDVYRLDSVYPMVNKYYNHNFWYDDAHNSSPSNNNNNSDENNEFNPFSCLIYVIWRLYISAVYINEISLATFTTKNFIGNRFNIDYSGVTDQKMRSYISRIRRKILLFVDLILFMSSKDKEIKSNENTDEKTLDVLKLIEKRNINQFIKPKELLSYNIISRYELSNLLTDIGVAIELHDKPINTPLYNAIAEYLNIDEANDMLEEELQEQLIVLQYKYNDNNKGTNETKNNDINLSEYNKEITLHYNVLVKGIRLTSCYEDSLLKMITTVERNDTNDLYDLVANDKWEKVIGDYDNQSKVGKIDERHTFQSINRVKQPLHGLQERKEVEIFPLFSNQTKHDLHPNFHSLKSIQKDVFSSYRFGSASSVMGVGTSIARSVTLQPKVTPSAVNVTNLKNMNNKSRSKTKTSSQYTKFEIDPKSQILSPTKSRLSTKTFVAATPQEINKKFMNDLREYKPIKKDQIIQKNKIKITNNNISSNRLSVIDNSKSNLVISFPKPFPEHLRHLVREKEEKQDNIYDNEDYYEDEEDDIDSINIDQIKSVINDYNKVFSKTDNKLSVTVTSSPDSINEEKESIKKQPIIVQNKYELPTEANKIKQQTKSVSAKFLQDLDSGIIPESRVSKPEVHRNPSPPFRPASNRAIPAIPVRNISLLNRRKPFLKSNNNNENNDNNALPGYRKNTATSMRKMSPKAERIEKIPNPLNESCYSINFSDNNSTTYDNYISNDIVDLKSDREEAINNNIKMRLNADDYDLDDCEGRVIKDVPDRKISVNNNNSNKLRTVPSLMKRKSIITIDKDDAFETLIKGFEAIKHGKSGNPKKKIIQYKTDLKIIEWRNSDDNKRGSLSTMFSSVFKLSKSKINNNNDGESNCDVCVSNKNSYISINDITEVRKGLQTDIFLKAGLLDPSCCLSIITIHRSLDIVFTTPNERNLIIKGLETLFDNEKLVIPIK